MHHKDASSEPVWGMGPGAAGGIFRGTRQHQRGRGSHKVEKKPASSHKETQHDEEQKRMPLFIFDLFERGGPLLDYESSLNLLALGNLLMFFMRPFSAANLFKAESDSPMSRILPAKANVVNSPV